MFGDDWLGHITLHIIGFFIFTLPVCWLILTVMLGYPFTLATVGNCAIGAGIVVVLLGLAKYGLDFSRD